MDCNGCVANYARVGFLAVLVTLALQAATLDARQAEASDTEELDSGFHLLYELKPEQARAQFAIWQAAHPEDPMGRASDAASYLFEECFRQGVLTSGYSVYWAKWRSSRMRSCGRHFSQRTCGRRNWRGLNWRKIRAI